MAKKYYWLRLHRDFFKRHDIKIIESMENGKDYVLFLLKLMAESVDHEGRLRFNTAIPYNDSMLATITGTNIDTVRSALRVFVELGLLERWDDETLYMRIVESMIGSRSDSADRMQLHRARKRELDESHVTKSDVTSISISNSLSKKEEETKNGELDDVIDYLNERAGKRYRHTETNRRLVNARLREGFTTDDCRTVIDNQTSAWKDDAKMNEYLRPATLFAASKFEGYLNRKSGSKRDDDYVDNGDGTWTYAGQL